MNEPRSRNLETEMISFPNKSPQQNLNGNDISSLSYNKNYDLEQTSGNLLQTGRRHLKKNSLYFENSNNHNNMLDLAQKTNSKILQASTSEVYGDPVIHPQTEDYWGHVNPIGIRSCYDEGKRCTETLFFDYHRQFATKIKIARIFNTYGPNMQLNDGRVVSNFIIQALNNSPITIYGTGQQTRSFCYVDDLISALIRLMDSEDHITGPINIGNPVEFTILELAEKVITLTKSLSKLKFEPLPKDDPRQRRPDINLAKKFLGWEPKMKIDEGLDKTILYFQDLLKA